MSDIIDNLLQSSKDKLSQSAVDTALSTYQQLKPQIYSLVFLVGTVVLTTAFLGAALGAHARISSIKFKI